MNFSIAYQNGSGRVFDYIVFNWGAPKTSLIEGTGLDADLIEEIIENGLSEKSITFEKGEYRIAKNIFRSWRDYSRNIHEKVRKLISSALGDAYADSKFKEKFVQCPSRMRKRECVNYLLEAVIEDFHSFEDVLSDVLRYHEYALNDDPELYSDVSEVLEMLGMKFPLNQLRIIPLSNISDSKPEEINANVVEQSDLINLDENYLPSPFYKRLIFEINKCYTVSAYVAVLILTRKLIENLIYDILVKKYSNDESMKEMYWAIDRNHAYGFGPLKGNFKKQKQDFIAYAPINKHLWNFLDKVQKYGNITTHTVELKDQKSNIEDIQEDLAHYIIFLSSIFWKIT